MLERRGVLHGVKQVKHGFRLLCVIFHILLVQFNSQLVFALSLKCVFAYQALFLINLHCNMPSLNLQREPVPIYFILLLIHISLITAYIIRVFNKMCKPLAITMRAELDHYYRINLKGLHIVNLNKQISLSLLILLPILFN